MQKTGATPVSSALSVDETMLRILAARDKSDQSALRYALLTA